MTREATEVCLRMLKESNKSRFDSYSVRNSVLIISHITYRDCRVHISSDNLSRNSCTLSQSKLLEKTIPFTAAHTYMAHITMAIPPPPLPHALTPPQGLEGSAWIGRLNLSSLSLLSFSELNKALDTNEYNWWRVLIFLPMERQTRSDWPLARNILLAIQHFSDFYTYRPYSFARITSKDRLLWGSKLQVLSSNLIPLRTKVDTQTTVISHRRRKRFSSSAVFFLRVSSAIADITWVFAIRASCFHISRENLGEASQACDESTLISGTSFFSQWYLPSTWQSTNTQIKIYEIVCNVVIYHILRSRNITLF